MDRGIVGSERTGTTNVHATITSSHDDGDPRRRTILVLRRGLRRHEAAAVLGVWTAVVPLPIEAIDFTSAGDLLRDLADAGRTLPSMDGLIAAIALRHDVPLLTLDRHFEVVPGLRRWPLEGG